MYLEQRWRRWYACHDIPKDVQGVLGKKRYCMSLGCEDRATARRLGAAAEAQWLGEIQRAREPGAEATQRAAACEARFAERLGAAEAAAESQALLLRGASPEEKSEALGYFYQDNLESLDQDIALGHGAYRMDDPRVQDPKLFAETARIAAIARGAIVRFGMHLEEYLGTLKNEAKSVDMKKSTILKFAEKFPYSADIERKAVQRWANAQLAEGKALATIRRSLSELRGYWGYLQTLGAVRDDAEPFDKLTMPKTGKSTAERRKAFTPADVVKIRAAAAGDKPLADLIAMAMWTGARLEELCSLKVAKVGDGYFDIEDAKTKAGWRQVPIHSRLKATMARLVKDSADGYVLSGLGFTKYGDRSGAIGKRFGRLKTDLGFGPELVFHSIRKTVATLFENAGVPEGTAAEIIGHDKPTMTFGLYSDGLSLEVKQAAIEKLAYPVGG